MGVPTAGQVVLLPFPYTDLTRNKLRPALLLAYAGAGDWVACQITSNPHADARAVPLTKSDFASGGLAHDSFLRPGKLFTANQSLFVGQPGFLNSATLDRIRTAVVAIIRGL